MVDKIDIIISDYVQQIEILESMKKDFNIIEVDSVEFALKKLKGVIKEKAKRKPDVFQTFV